MRICMVTSASFPPSEGMGNYIWNLSHFLASENINVHIVTRGGFKQTSWEDLEWARIWRVPYFPVFPFHVHLHGQFVEPLIHKLESDIDIFHIHSPLPPQISSSKPTMLTFHSSVREDVNLTPVTSLFTLLMKLQAPISYKLERSHLRRATKVNAVSPRTAEVLHNYPSCPPEIGVVWNGVDTELFTPNAGPLSDEKNVLIVSRLAPGKGLYDLVNAAAIVLKIDSSICFIIVGEGILRSSLEKRIKELKLERNIFLLGHVNNQIDLVKLYRKASVFVLPSHHEGLPTVLLEAMSCGCPVVSTDVGGIPWVIDQGKNGILLSPHKPIDLANMIYTLITNPNILAEMGKQARRTIEEKFSWRSIGKQFLNSFECMI